MLDPLDILDEALGDGHSCAALYRELVPNIVRAAWHADRLGDEAREEFFLDQQFGMFNTALATAMTPIQARLFSTAFVSLARVLADTLPGGHATERGLDYATADGRRGDSRGDAVLR